MRKLILICLLALPSYAVAQEATWHEKPSANTCRGIAPGGALLWTPCLLSWQKEIVRQGRTEDVSPGSIVFRQDVAANKTKPEIKPEEKKFPPIIVIPAAEAQKLSPFSAMRRIHELELENARLKVANAEAQFNVSNQAFSQAVVAAASKITGKPVEGEYDIAFLPDGSIRLAKKNDEKAVDAPPKAP